MLTNSDGIFDDVDDVEENFNKTSEEDDINDASSNEFYDEASYDFNLDFDEIE